MLPSASLLTIKTRDPAGSQKSVGFAKTDRVTVVGREPRTRIQRKTKRRAHLAGSVLSRRETEALNGCIQINRQTLNGELILTRTGKIIAKLECDLPHSKRLIMTAKISKDSADSERASLSTQLEPAFTMDDRIGQRCRQKEFLDLELFEPAE